MTTTTHTPTPWAAVADRVEQLESGACIARAATCYGAGAVEREKANAAHIVRCVNAHDELVAALEAITDHLAAVMANHPLQPKFAANIEGIPTIRAARAALAKSNG